MNNVNEDLKGTEEGKRRALMNKEIVEDGTHLAETTTLGLSPKSIRELEWNCFSKNCRKIVGE
jgi:hypothetical protein